MKKNQENEAYIPHIEDYDELKSISSKIDHTIENSSKSLKNKNYSSKDISDRNSYSKIALLKRLFLMVKPIRWTMFKSIVFGILGHLFSIFLLGFSAMLLSDLLGYKTIGFTPLIFLILISGILRGVLRYREQFHGHDVAFKLLAVLRRQIFEKLRILSPAKLMSKQSGSIIQMIQADVEAIETFFAHTIAPIMIAIIVPTIILFLIGIYGLGFMLILLLSYLIVGVFLPIIGTKIGKESGKKYQWQLEKINNRTLDNLQGLKEVILYNNQSKVLKEINEDSKRLISILGNVRFQQNKIKMGAEVVIFISTASMIILGLFYLNNVPDFILPHLIIIVVISYTSFGPLLALIPFGGYLSRTLAAAERIISLLDETPLVTDIINKNTDDEVFLENKDIEKPFIHYNNIDFKYPKMKENVLENIYLEIPKKSKLAIIGKSGSGKSTLLHLLLRYWDVEDGEILLYGKNLKDYSLSQLRSAFSLFSTTHSPKICLTAKA